MRAASQASRACLRVVPQWYSPNAPVLRITRWQGIRNATGLAATALATGALFSLGALGCSLAAAIDQLLVSRFFQGIGGGLILAGALAFTSVLYGPELRRTVIAVTNITWIIAAVIGPVQAGIFADLAWRMYLRNL